MHHKHYGIQAMLFAVVSMLLWAFKEIEVTPYLILISGILAVFLGSKGFIKARQAKENPWLAAAAVALGAVSTIAALITFAG